MKFMHHVSKLLDAATSSFRWALPGLLCKEIPASFISTANSDVAKVLLKDPIRSEGHTRNRENYFVKLFSMLKTRKFWSSKIKSYTVLSLTTLILGCSTHVLIISFFS